MSMAIGSRGSTSSEINVTPLIDVLLVLLIIFMVVFPYQSMGEKTHLPQQKTDTSPAPPEKPIVIQLNNAGSESQRPRLKINEQEIRWKNLGSRLQEIYSGRAEKVAFLKGDPEIDFQYVVEAIDIANHAGVARLALMSR